MMMSKVGKPFWATKKVHVLTLQTLIEVCSKASSFVVDLFGSIGLHLPSFIFKYPRSLLVPFIVFTSVYVVGNNIRACHVLCHHMLAMELDIDIFT